MTWKSGFVFRILIGGLFIAQYFLGFDGSGRGAGNIMTLGFGVLFIGYGVFGFFQLQAIRKKTALKLGLQENTSWEEIQDVILKNKVSKDNS